MVQYRAALAFNEYLLQATLDYWTACAFPVLQFAKYL